MQVAPQQVMAPVAQAPMNSNAVHIGNAGALRMKHMPYDFEGKYPYLYTPCCTKSTQAWRANGVNTLIHGAGPTGENTLLVKEENVMMQTEGCCMPAEEYANSNVKIFAGADEFRNKELYRIQMEGPEAGFCMSKLEYVSQVMGTDPSKKMKMVGESVMVYDPSPCNAFCGVNSVGDVNIVNKETGAQFNIAAIPLPKIGCCTPKDKLDFSLPVTMANGQEVGRIVKDEGQKRGAGCLYSHWDMGLPTVRFEKRMQLTDDDQALIIAGAHQNGHMRKWWHSVQSVLCFGKVPNMMLGHKYGLLQLL